MWHLLDSTRSGFKILRSSSHPKHQWVINKHSTQKWLSLMHCAYEKKNSFSAVIMGEIAEMKSIVLTISIIICFDHVFYTNFKLHVHLLIDFEIAIVRPRAQTTWLSHGLLLKIHPVCREQTSLHQIYAKRSVSSIWAFYQVAVHIALANWIASLLVLLFQLCHKMHLCSKSAHPTTPLQKGWNRRPGHRLTSFSRCNPKYPRTRGS